MAAALAQPGAWTIPAATLTCIAVSLFDRRAPLNTDRMLSRIHTPEAPRVGGTSTAS
jgi:hypothetical protein